ncbi:MAG: RNA polymerase sigma-70 factor [Nocardioidaceae bacterium]|nr:RNA polymerase sigma-70 factor [Nocardioidaceae bacterium]NUS49495.1 RNA polymerase sigma-70 factor [Nocardioidaceae bacterium]
MTDPFEEHRGLLFTVAYEMLGSVADAEDVLQDSWLRWDHAAQDEVRDPRAYLVRLVTRQALNRLRTVKRQRETYVGPWLPEPLATTPDVAEDVELADSVSVAMLVVLETLTPLERAVFVLREVFGYEYDEIAGATDRTADAVRQLASRARKHVQARRPRVELPPDAAEVTERFLTAVRTGDVERLMQVMAPDVLLVTDGGGVKQAALRPIEGAEKVARWFVGVASGVEGFGVEWTTANGRPGVLLLVDGVLDTFGTVVVEDGRLKALYLVRNPDKLGHLTRPRDLTRR